MKDLNIALENRPGALAEMGEALGRATRKLAFLPRLARCMREQSVVDRARQNAQ